ncbi:MAG: septum formation initiator family protein [Polaromonas sp.]|nr:septum formation initiator family protein [Polaromonas sp.]MBK9340884.1 septum formation initiator family protein [Rhodoferax sp.]MBK7027665.1 septum formation initiator family protein [Polaromonas sp.]MBK7502284.1 septum formation initiator family protein [Polaromonas sp.]MBL0252842.1 septum formation initiator family protein [Polaromonas sp.]
MKPSRIVFFLLLALLLTFQGQLWFGRGSLRDNAQMQQKLNGINKNAERLKAENEQLKAEVDDLKDPTGRLEMVEEKARMELGMIKPGEIYVQIAK